jgi:Zn-dependent peptidase ImmA (M78 family)
MEDMTTVPAYINRNVLAWAIERHGSTPEQIAKKPITAESIHAWINGDALPTERQAEWLAQRLRIPYLVLFLSSKPAQIDKITLPDLRTVRGRGIAKPSLEFVETVNDVLCRQDWYREHRNRLNASRIAFVGKYGLSDSPAIVAADMRAVLDFEPSSRSDWKDSEELLKELTRNAERAGVLVMRSGFVGHAWNRKLNPQEFRGFASSDTIAPVVFVNDKDSRAAQNFTLAHELAHIWIGESGISNVNMRNATTANQIERFCNQVAAEFLVPSASFNRAWSDNDTLRNNVQRICSLFKVSSLVALLRALENGRLDYPAFRLAYDTEEEGFKKKKEKGADEETREQGGQFWYSFPWRVSNLFGQAIAESVRNERTTYSEAAKLLKVPVSTFETYLIQETGT